MRGSERQNREECITTSSQSLGAKSLGSAATSLAITKIVYGSISTWPVGNKGT